MTEDNTTTINALGMVIIFSFISIVFLFIALLILASINNFAVGKLYDLTNSYISQGLIPASYSTTADLLATGLLDVLPYLDMLWFGGFSSLVISGLVFSYLRKRENYFSLFTFTVLGIIIFVYFGSLIIQITQWFQAEIFLTVFPTISPFIPFFTWYISNVAIINLVLTVLFIIANYVDLDLTRFTQRKQGENFGEI